MERSRTQCGDGFGVIHVRESEPRLEAGESRQRGALRLHFIRPCSYVLRTERFANTKDFVAKLSVLSGSQAASQDSGYPNGSVLTNSKHDGTGHLFGAQYSLDAGNEKGCYVCHY